MYSAQYNLLGTSINIRCENRKHLAYPSFFLDAYSREIVSPVVHDEVWINMTEGNPVAPSDDYELKGVHRSKHTHWNFNAAVRSGERGSEAFWIGRNFQLLFDKECKLISGIADKSAPPATAGENLFHLMRSIALYKRKPSDGAMIHASAVIIGGEAVVFAGQSNSGKTTLFTELVLNHDAIPLANDRVLLCPEKNGIIAKSWPSYCSYCEGTLLNFPVLAEAARRYEAEGYQYRTISWPAPLESSFTKDRKRIFPMGWICEATGIRYSQQVPLGTIVFVKYHPAPASLKLEVLNYYESAQRDGLVKSVRGLLFDEHEPSFLDWHGLRLSKDGAFSAEDIVETIIDSEIPVIHASIPAGDPEAIINLKKLLHDTKRYHN